MVILEATMGEMISGPSHMTVWRWSV
jgi:hypothetical protein